RGIRRALGPAQARGRPDRRKPRDAGPEADHGGEGAMSNVLVIVETDASGPKAAALPGVTAGQMLAAKTGGQLHLLVLGAAPQAAAQALAQGGYGASTVHVVAHPELEPFTAEAWTD